MKDDFNSIYIIDLFPDILFGCDEYSKDRKKIKVFCITLLIILSYENVIKQYFCMHQAVTSPPNALKMRWRH